MDDNALVAPGPAGAIRALSSGCAPCRLLRVLRGERAGVVVHGIGGVGKSTPAGPGAGQAFADGQLGAFLAAWVALPHQSRRRPAGGVKSGTHRAAAGGPARLRYMDPGDVSVANPPDRFARAGLERATDDAGSWYCLLPLEAARRAIERNLTPP
jgi:hypothetical protein